MKKLYIILLAALLLTLAACLTACTYEFKNVRYVVLGVLEPIQ